MGQQATEQTPEVTQGEPAPQVVVHPVTVEVRVRLQALAIPEPDGGYSVIVPALPGCVTMGDTIEEVQAMVVEAAELWLAVAHDLGRDEALRLVRE
ncbi:MAG: type II toxin-antitoxin system HicB family antitoxin [Planctomycetia bacterium]|nr:type II toxin-antitoxin system HicB family antitoxin [Planctomycetia bacterium]